MEFTDYKIADVKDQAKIVERLATLEKDLSQDIGGDVVLIAYQRNETLQA